MKAAILFFAAACAAWANNCALNVGTAAHYTFSTTVASDWTNCGSTTPQNGDNVSITGTAHTFTFDQARTFGTGQAPYLGYVSSITGAAGGSTACSGSQASLGGTITGNIPGRIGCTASSGYCTLFIYERGFYSSTSGVTTNPNSMCTGGSPTWTLNWSAGGGTPALLCGSQSSCIISAALIARGDVLSVDAYGDHSTGLTLSNGGQVTFDFSLSAASTVMYNFGNQGNAGSWSRGFVTDGTCTKATCGITTTGGGIWRLSQGGGASLGPIFSMDSVTLAHAGDASEPWIYMVDNRTPYGAFTLTNSHVDTSSMAYLANVDTPGPVMLISGNSFTNSVKSNLAVQSGAQPANFSTDSGSSWDGSGTRSWMNNASDIALLQTVGAIGFTISGNFSQGDFLPSADYASPWSSASNNFFAYHTHPQSFGAPGDWDHNVFFGFDATANNHLILDNNMQRNTSETYGIYGVAVANSGDSGELSQIPASSSYSTTFSYNIILPDPAMHSWSEPGGSPFNNAGTAIHNHNYWYADYGASTPSFGFEQLDETQASHSGVIASMRCNTLWNPTDANSFVKMDDQGVTPTVTDPAASGNADYNWGRGSATTQTSACSGCTNQANGYVSHFSSGNVPGVHDNNAIDSGVNYLRTIEAFATDYLGITATAWSSGSSYTQGQTVSSSVSGFYNGKTLVYTCWIAAGCPAGTAPQPGNGRAWFNYWEPYTMTYLKSNVPAGTKLVDGALQVLGIGEDTACTAANPCDTITAVRHWISAGHIPANRNFWGACAMDSKSIGPIDGASNSRPGLAVVTN